MDIEDIKHVVDDSEKGLFEFSRAHASGALGRMSYDDVFDIATRSSESVSVAANALGRDPDPDDTPDDLRSRMMSVYTDEWMRATFEDTTNRSLSETASLQEASRRSVMSVLGMTDRTMEGIDLDVSSGDMSPAIKMWESYLFN